MSSSNFERRWSAARLYRFAKKSYTWLPYTFSKNGYAFPTWHYYLEVTRRCNLHCQMCVFINWFRNTPVPLQREGELTTEEWFRVIDQVRRFSLVTFTGGEPFMRDDFLELLARASAKTRTHVISNAVLMTEDRAKRLVELAPRKIGGVGFNFAGVSIEGPAEVHDAIRGMPGAFKRSTENVKRLLELRDSAGKKCPMIHMTSVIQDANLDTLAEMPRIASEAGADVLNLTLELRTLTTEGLGAVDPASYEMSQVEFPHANPERVAKALRETRAAAAKVGIELRTPDMPDDVIVQYYSGKMDLRNFHCPGIWTEIIVSAKGDVWPPCWLMKAGNVREKDLKEIWNGPEFRAFRRKIRNGLCAPCLGCCSLAYKGPTQG